MILTFFDKNYNNFLKNSPSDHYTIFNYKNASSVLKDYGFKVYKINVTGHHPERFSKMFKGRFFMKLFRYISYIFKLGDTFEIYAVKEQNL